MSRLRLAAVSFLNTRPITYGLERGLGETRFELSFDVPSRCADAVASDQADLAVMPLAEYAAHPAYGIVPGIAIASHGPVRTVLLVGETPWTAWEEIALDDASRTSAMLTRLLCRRRGLAPRMIQMPHDDIVAAAHGRRGALVIGDAAFDAAERLPHVYDLADEWRTETGLPFVFAVWAGRTDRLQPGDIELLQESLAQGLEHRAEIARAAAETGGRDPSFYQRYLTHELSYSLGTGEMAGATEFLASSHAAGLLTTPPTLRVCPPPRPRKAAPPSLDRLLSDAACGVRLDAAGAERLLVEAPLMELGRAADLRRGSLHPDGVVTYIVDRNVNYTNVCVTSCKFCNFSRPPGHGEAYVLSRAQLAEKLGETVALGGTQILLQGGIHPDLKLGWFEDLFRWMKSSFPLAIHGLSPEEIRRLADMEGLQIPTVLERLVAAGLDSIPGGGAEILDDEIRRRISPLKCTTATWLEVMRAAHQLGLRTTATMVFGFGEQPRHTIAHLQRVRDLQDETAGFTAFICWSFQAEGTRLPLEDDTTAMRYLRTFAVARLVLDNVPNLQVSWPTMGPEVGQVGLRFGGNDFGSAMIEENVVASAGAVFNLTAADIERFIRGAGFVPRRRNMRYELLPP